VEAGRSRGRDRTPGARPEQRVLADQRAVEVAGEGLDLAREVRGESQLPFVRNATSASIWDFGRLAKLGITGG
jgi:hypothetical protein